MTLLGAETYLRLSALAVAAVPLGSETSSADDDVPAAALGENWDAVRRQFRLASDKIDMSAMLLASHPTSVRAAIARHRDGLDIDTVAYIEDNNDALQQQARTAAGEYLDVHPSHIALTDSTTTGVGLIYGGLVLRPEDEILTTSEDYYVTHELTRLAALRSGAALREVPLFEDLANVSVEQLVETVIGAVGPSTRVLALTWVHSSTGLKLPISEIAARLGAINAERKPGREVLLCVDGVHGFGVEDVSFGVLGCDFLMAGCHKWLFGPRGTGIVAASRRGLDSISAVIPSFLSERSFTAWIRNREPVGAIDAASITPGGFKAFEHLWALPEAFAFHKEIGKARIAERTHQLAARLKDGLAAIEGVMLRTPRDPALSAGIVAFDLTGWNPHRVVRRLREHGIVGSVAPYASQHIRLTPSIRNTEAEVDTVIAALAALAG